MGISNHSAPAEFPFLSFGESGLKELAEKYPWCSIVQLSLLQSYKKNNSTHFDKQASKTSLFFNNTGWLNWQLHQPALVDEVPVEIKDAAPLISADPEVPIEHTSPSPKVTNTPVPSDDVIVFEPLHATDYFASQGIRLTDEPIANDKLGSQMKSFTEWLKSMKKTHKEDQPQGDAQTDRVIQQIAEHSNMDTDVVTEAMAEVLLKQDKTEKALAVYRKLSLINPSKSAYFAAKIESLSTGRQL